MSTSINMSTMFCPSSLNPRISSLMVSVGFHPGFTNDSGFVDGRMSIVINALDEVVSRYFIRPVICSI